MRKLPLTKLFLACAIFLASLTAAWADSKASLVDSGDNTYVATRSAGTTFDRDVDRLKSEALADANKYAAGKGMQAKVVSTTGKKPWYLTGFATASVTFKLYSAGDPALTAPVDATGTPIVTSQAAAPSAPPSLSTDELVAALTKLDDLRKKGILTQDEFDSEKKKLLNRSR